MSVPGAEGPWLFSVAPLGPARIVWSGVFAPRTKGWKPPEEKDGDVAAFARTRVNPGVATSPHSGECGYTEPAGSPWLFSIAPIRAKNSATSKLTLRVSMLTDSAAVVIGKEPRFFGRESLRRPNAVG